MLAYTTPPYQLPPTPPYTQRPATEEAVEAAAKYLESTLKQLMEVLDAIMEEREDVFDGDY